MTFTLTNQTNTAEQSRLQAQMLLIAGAIELLFPREAKGITKAAWRGIVRSWEEDRAKPALLIVNREG